MVAQGPTTPTRPPAGDELTGFLMAVADRRDKTAFAALFGHFAPRVKAYLIRLGTAPAQAEDLAQETMLTLWRKAPQFDPAKAQAATWVFTIARNLRIDHLRRERYPQAPEEVLTTLPDSAPHPDEHTLAGQRQRRVRAVLAELPADQAEVIRMSFFDDAPHVEIAERLGLPLGTVKSRIRLAMKRIRTALGDET